MVGHVRELARAHTAEAVRTLETVMKNAKAPPAARVAAATAMLDRGYGRPGPMSARVMLPDLCSADDAAKAIATIAKAAADGDLAPSEAADLARLVEAYMTAVEATKDQSAGAEPGSPAPVVNLIFGDAIVSGEPPSRPVTPVKT